MSENENSNKRKRRGFWGRVGSGIDTTRRVLTNGVFLLVIVVLVGVFIASRPTVPERAALVLEPRGVVVDELSAADPLTALLQARDGRETRLRDLIKAVDRAAGDPRIELLEISLDKLEHIGISKSLELAEAIERFRETGKRVIATADTFNQDQYFLALQADEIYMHPMGAVILEGFGVFRQYFRRALDRLEVEFHVFRVGELKTALEPFTRDDMSETEREVTLNWLTHLWDLYLDTVTERREISREDLEDYVNRIDRALARHGGNSGAAARELGLVDQLMDRAARKEMLSERVGSHPRDGYNQIKGRHYLAATGDPREPADGQIGVVMVQGMIVDGEQRPGVTGADSVAELVRRAEEDDNIRALVLRVDSGGGSAFASEVMREALLRFKRSGKPLVVSMGSIAASGGYWIAADADEIWATPASLTGSLGVFGAFPTIDGALGKLGVSTDGVGTTEVAGGMRIDRPLNPVVANALQSTIEHTYRRFLGIIAEGRGMMVEQVEELADGRVWTGSEALDMRLVDRVGSLDQAVSSAAELAALEHYEAVVMRSPLPFPQQVLRNLIGAEALLQAVLPGTAAQRRQFAGLIMPWRTLAAMNDPRGLYAYCVVCVAP